MSSIKATPIAKVLESNYDYVIVGAGIGGGTIGLSLAQKGKKVLFVDRGLIKKDVQVTGFPEEQLKLGQDLLGADNTSLLKSFGRCTQKVVDISYGKSTAFIPLLGEGAGGSSSVYGAAFERFFKEDFQPVRFHRETEGSDLVNWPIQYEDLEKHYSTAEKMYAAVGQRDPLRVDSINSFELPSRPWTEDGAKLSQGLQQKGLHPYLLPVAHVDWTKKTCPGCQGSLCQNHEKKDSFNSAIRIALEKFGAHFLENADVQQLEAEENKISQIKVLVDEKSYILSAPKIILAAGAIFTPALLLKSKNKFWPRGLGNTNDLVGRYLCRHYMDLVTLKKLKNNNPEKEFALNDFYLCKDGKFGTVQSLGNNPPGRAIIAELVAELKSERKILRYLGLWFLSRLPFAHIIANHVLKGTNMALIMEDLPYFENRVLINVDGQITIKYEMHPAEQKRLDTFRKKVLKAFAGYGPALQAQGENNQRLAHASGTCRMGLDPQNSVVDVSNKVHGLENLYIVDSSFFPTSGGINPSLTIAANALRVADLLEGS